MKWNERTSSEPLEDAVLEKWKNTNGERVNWLIMTQNCIYFFYFQGFYFSRGTYAFLKIEKVISLILKVARVHP